MADHLTAEKRSWNMSRIRSANTRPELAVRSFLHQRGFRFRVHISRLPGKPDIVLPKYQTAIFVHGCFWHSHYGCRNAVFPQTRPDFWRAKILGNKLRDAKVARRLRSLGWKVLTIWECETEAEHRLAKRLTALLQQKI